MVRIVGFVTGFGLLACGILLGGSLASFFNIPSILIVVGCALAFTVSAHSLADIGQTMRAASGSAPISAVDFHRHDAVLETLSNTSIAAGLIGTLIGLVQMLSKMDDPTAIGPAFAVALLTLLYGAVLSGFVFTPMRGRLRRRSTLEAGTPAGPSAVLPTVSALFGITLMSGVTFQGML